MIPAIQDRQGKSNVLLAYATTGKSGHFALFGFCQTNFIHSSNISTFSVPSTMSDPKTLNKYDAVSALRCSSVAGQGRYMNRCWGEGCKTGRKSNGNRGRRGWRQRIFRNYFWVWWLGVQGGESGRERGMTLKISSSQTSSGQHKGRLLRRGSN